MAHLVPFEKPKVNAYLDRCVRYWRGKKAAGDPTADHYIDAFQSIRRSLFGDVLPLDETEPPDDLQEDVGVTTVTDPDETMCAACGHSKSRHDTAGGFCKHCPCNAFAEEPVKKCKCDLHSEEISNRHQVRCPLYRNARRPTVPPWDPYA